MVRHILYERNPIFTEEDCQSLSFLPLRLVNRLHVDTRVRVVRRELLFEEGERADAELFSESERKLRATGIFGDAEIVTIPVPGDSVDVVVRTREIWTTAVNASYERYENETLWAFQIKEKNLLGMARGFEFARSEDIDRNTWTLGVSDRQMIDGTWDGRLRWSSSSDGSSIGWSLDREFVQLTDSWAVRTRYRDAQLSPRYYVAENLYLRPDARRTNARVEFGRRMWVEPGGVWRGLVGVGFEHQNFFAPAPLNLYSPSGQLPVTMQFPHQPSEVRDWNTLYLGLERRSRSFESMRFLAAMGTREDIALGPEWAMRTGWAAPWMGSTETGLRVLGNLSWNTRLSRHWLQSLRAQTGGLVRGDGGRDLRLRMSFSQYHQPMLPVTVAWGLVGGIAERMDRGRVFHLGLNSGLRAARFRELSGDRLLRANFEIRVTDTSNRLHLVTPGIVAFADFGNAWFKQDRDFRWDHVRGAYGFGLRFGFNRAAADVPVRVDFAWPMLYPSTQPGPIVSIGTGHVF